MLLARASHHDLVWPPPRTASCLCASSRRLVRAAPRRRPEPATPRRQEPVQARGSPVLLHARRRRAPSTSRSFPRRCPLPSRRRPRQPAAHRRGAQQGNSHGAAALDLRVRSAPSHLVSGNGTSSTGSIEPRRSLAAGPLPQADLSQHHASRGHRGQSSVFCFQLHSDQRLGIVYLAQDPPLLQTIHSKMVCVCTHPAGPRFES